MESIECNVGWWVSGGKKEEAGVKDAPVYFVSDSGASATYVILQNRKVT